MIIAPEIINPFEETTLKEVKEHVAHIRRCFDWPGIPYHDAGAEESNRFNRFFWHNLPLLKTIHHDPTFIKKVSDHFGVALKPSYCFLSMYGPEGVCPVHTDRPQCQFTVDLQVDSDGTWPITVDGKEYLLVNGQALAYSGTGHVHYRKPMKMNSAGPVDGRATFMNLAFFHFVPTAWMGKLE